MSSNALAGKNGCQPDLTLCLSIRIAPGSHNQRGPLFLTLEKIKQSRIPQCFLWETLAVILPWWWMFASTILWMTLIASISTSRWELQSNYSYVSNNKWNWKEYSWDSYNNWNCKQTILRFLIIIEIASKLFLSFL